MKNLSLILMLILLLTACNNTEPVSTVETTTSGTETAVETTSPELLILTLEELAQYNGKNGQPAYVAIDGIIYDMTDSSFWQEGNHNGFEAGRDLTEPLNKQSPHGASKLKNVPIVGEVIEASSQSLEEEKVEEPSTAPTTEESSDAMEEPNEIESASESETQIEEAPATESADASTSSESTSTNEEAVTVSDPSETNDDMTSTEVEESLEEPPANAAPSDSNNNGLVEYTLAQLSQFTGKDGALAYIGYKGLVYDVSNLGPWNGGQHNGNYAGFDLTDDLAYASHGEEKLDKATIVGEIVN